MISSPLSPQGSNAALYQPSHSSTPQSPFPPEKQDSIKLSTAALKEKAIVEAGRNQAALNFLNLQIMIGKRLQQLQQAPLTVATLPMGEFRQLSEAIGPGGHPHHPSFPPPFCPPPPPPPTTGFSSSALQTASEGPPQPAEPPPNPQPRFSMLA